MIPAKQFLLEKRGVKPGRPRPAPGEHTLGRKVEHTLWRNGSPNGYGSMNSIFFMSFFIGPQGLNWGFCPVSFFFSVKKSKARFRWRQRVFGPFDKNERLKISLPVLERALSRFKCSSFILKGASFKSTVVLCASAIFFLMLARGMEEKEEDNNEEVTETNSEECGVDF
uniref:Uncharacterized protein n=1 Tax=Solanum lycopersicum TaxID=4081 RepID=A0A3Q7H7W6_SOLLC